MGTFRGRKKEAIVKLGTPSLHRFPSSQPAVAAAAQQKKQVAIIMSAEYLISVAFGWGLCKNTQFHGFDCNRDAPNGPVGGGCHGTT
jgi:hypothetical protein